VDIGPVTRKDAGGEGTLQRGEEEDGVWIAAEDELVQPLQSPQTPS